MVRVSVKESSNANNLVNFTAGLKDVICDVPAHLQIRRTALTGTGLTATGTNQATALAIPGDVAMHDFSTVAGSTGARLDPVTDKSNVFIVNRGANQLRVYPATGQTINANGTNSPYLVNPSSVVQLIGRTASNWQTLPSYNGGTVNSQSSSNGLFLNGTGISPGTYGNSYFIPQIVVGSDGRLTFAQDLLPYISYTQVYDITTAFALYSTGGLSRGEVVALASAEFN